MYKIALLASHPPQKDPRCGWFSQAAPPSIRIEQFGVARTVDEPQMNRSAKGVHTVARMHIQNEEALQNFLINSREIEGGIQEWLNCHRLSVQSLQSLSNILDTSPADRRLGYFIGSMQHFSSTTASVVNAVSQSGHFDGIIACDLDTLIAGIILKNFYKCPLIYDAHEFWPEADIDQANFEKEYWIGLEARLLQHVDLALTVSPSLCQIMEREYGVPFQSLPNAEPLASLPRNAEASAPMDMDRCVFLFQGGFAKGRGIDLLIEAWPSTQIANEILLLRGPNNEYKYEMIWLAKRRGLLDKTIFFPDPVEESQLIVAAQSASVGVIPYTPTGINYSNCCPNKLSQYMAAGIAVLANNTKYVESIVRNSNIGKVLDFNCQEDLAEAISSMTTDHNMRSQYAQNSYNYFISSFNWDKLSEPFYTKLEKLLATQKRAEVGSSSAVVLGRKLVKNSQKVNCQAPEMTAVTNMLARLGLLIWLRLPNSIKSWIIDEAYKVKVCMRVLLTRN